ncbi:cation:proton antiporter [Allorhizocola rhizosphaerae]|uniref:cation:proton antiporter n=1 Tax=Allorhizocola rhizosphaerae TaxID=1872709 RepID=UPI001B8BD69B|nr:sodium:proton antiporter [Allorhizocola rhizosphaerae]
MGLMLLLVVLGLLAVPIGERLRLPAPVVAALFGVLVALLPGGDNIAFPPGLILPLVLPPLLFTAAWKSSWQRFLKGWSPILTLAVALVFATTAAVAFVASRIHPALPLGAAVVLGAICAPPDPAAISNVAKRLGVSRRIVTILEGEGLFNDVTALTIYQVAVVGVLTGSFTWWHAAGNFVYAAVAGVVIGLANAFVFDRLSNRLGGAELRAGLSLLIPYSAYLAADLAKASGVLAVLVAGFWIGHSRRDPDDVEERLYGRSFWEVVEVLVTGFTFGLVGLEFVTVTDRLGGQAWSYVTFSLIICLVLVLARFFWMFVVGGIVRFRHRHSEEADIPGNWRETLLVAWAGMRAVVTVATALALPAMFPARDQIIFVAVVVALLTLLVPGVTLPALVSALGLNTGADRRRAARREVIAAINVAATGHLDELRRRGEITDAQADWLTIRWRATLLESGEEDELAQRYPERHHVKAIHADMLARARAAALRLRPKEPEAVDEVLRELDLRSAVS